MKRVMTSWWLALGLASCAEKAQEGKLPESGSMMAGDSMAMMAMPMFPRVEAHLDSLGSTQPAMHDAAMASHGMVMDSLLSAMQTDLMHMGMNREASYDALADSAIKDLSRIAAAPPAEQDALLQEHLARVRRLMQFYETMVAKGK